MCNLQKLIPQHWLSKIIGLLANSEIVWLKNLLINFFIRFHSVKMHEAIEENHYVYKSFNKFFTRKLKSKVRPIAEGISSIISPADGTIYQIGHVSNNNLPSAKGSFFTVKELFGRNLVNTEAFNEGAFITIYLAPMDYHRVHMPMTGTLEQMIYIPGRLFSVNKSTADQIPRLFAINERVINIFQTDFGKMAVILVGALFVGSIETSWMGVVNRKHNENSYAINYSVDDNYIHITKGEEVGLFKMGSTVIVLFEKSHAKWNINLAVDNKIMMGQKLGESF